MTLLIGPLVAIVGVLAAAIVLRGRARSRRNLYASLRADRERRIREARERALAPVRTRPGQITQPLVAHSLQAQPALAAGTIAPGAPSVQSSSPGLPTPHTPYGLRLEGSAAAVAASQRSAESGTGLPTPAESPRPTAAMTALSYAGLVAALVVVLLGVLLMVTNYR